MHLMYGFVMEKLLLCQGNTRVNIKIGGNLESHVSAMVHHNPKEMDAVMSQAHAYDGRHNAQNEG
jgi:hypothetical protein